MTRRSGYEFWQHSSSSTTRTFIYPPNSAIFLMHFALIATLEVERHSGIRFETLRVNQCAL
jgi:hypothetical protein